MIPDTETVLQIAKRGVGRDWRSRVLGAVVLLALVAVLRPDAGRDPRPVSSRFDDRFWRQLMFNQYDRFDSNALRAWSPALWDGSEDPFGHDRFRMPDIYIWRADAPAGTIRYIREHLPGLWTEMTGRPFTGRIRDGVDEAAWLPNTIGVRFEFQPRRPDGLAGVCGRAAVGPDSRGWTVMRFNPDCIGDPHELFANTFAHELGHALGFFHVGQRGTVMHPTDWEADWPTPPERYHMRLAYDVGSGQRYCGWPFSVGCDKVEGTELQPSAVRPVAID